MRYAVVFVLAAGLLLQAVPAQSLTKEEIVYLKKNGVSDETIQLMLASELEKQKHEDTTIRVTDEESAVVYSTGKPSETPLSREQQQDVDRAWNMLENLFIDVKK